MGLVMELQWHLWRHKNDHRFVTAGLLYIIYLNLTLCNESSLIYVAVFKATSHFPIAIPDYSGLGLGCTFFLLGLKDGNQPGKYFYFFFSPFLIAFLAPHDLG